MKISPELLLHPNIPKPLHGLTPRNIFGQEWWDIERQKAYKENDYHCWACGVPKIDATYHQWLEAHEHYNINYKTGEVKFIRIVALCHSCHNYIHDGRMKSIVGTEKLSYEKYENIIRHGEAILKASGFDIFKPIYPKCNVAWNDWYLFMEGKKYFSKFKSLSEWYQFYNKI